MKVHFLGVHHEESKETNLVSFLIDDILAVDAGCLSAELSFLKQKKIKAILLSHGHYDHIKGVPSFIFNNLDRQTKIYSTEKTLNILSSHLFDGIIYPKFTEKTSFLEKPPIKLIPISPLVDFDVEGYIVKPLQINHTEGSIGYQIKSKSGKKIFFSGDTGPHLSEIWKRISPDLIIIDVTFPNSMENIAKDSLHLCPSLLKKELEDFYQLKNYYPKVFLIHLSPKHEKEIRDEIKKLSKEMNIIIKIPVKGEIIDL